MTNPFAKPESMEMPESPLSGSIVARLVVAWTLVGIPLAWGVWQVFKKSLDLFR
ncbi:MAG TPA: hypothetical protein VK636_17350 [Gemmatimonadaceae bacterium]|nr:hypothetical protein [Gemmatimonadaceae bacterium]